MYTLLKMNTTSNILKVSTLCALLVIFFIPGTHGQNKTVNQYGDTVMIIGTYSPTVADATKIGFNPAAENNETGVQFPELNYSIESVKLLTNIELDPIKSVPFENEALEKLYRNYVKAGFGNYTTPFLDFYITPVRNAETQFGLNLKHMSSSGKVDKNYANSSYSTNSLGLYAKKFNRDNTISGNFDLSRNVVHYYGYKPDEIQRVYPDADIKQRYQSVSADLKIKSNNPDPDGFNYKVAFDPWFVNNINKTSELKLGLNARIEKGIELINNKITQLNLEADIDYFFNGDTVENFTSGITTLSPFINLNFGQYLLKLGFKTSFETDKDQSVYFFPDIEAVVGIVPQYLTAFVGFKGGIERNSYRQLIRSNPYISGIVPLKSTRNKFEIYGGITGNIDKSIDFTIRLCNRSSENVAFFVEDTTLLPLNIFTVTYDNASITNAQIEIGYHFAEKIKLNLAFILNNYSTETEEKAWQKPSISTNLEANYNLSDKFLVKLALIGQDKQYAKVYTDGKFNTKEIGGFVDLNIGLEYRHKPNLSFFIDLNNLTGKQYEIWYNYPVQKFNALGGVSYSF